jgi:hypothetical protein
MLSASATRLSPKAVAPRTLGADRGGYVPNVCIRVRVDRRRTAHTPVRLCDTATIVNMEISGLLAASRMREPTARALHRPASAIHFFVLGICFAAVAAAFFCWELAFFLTFCAACFWFAFGDLSPMSPKVGPQRKKSTGDGRGPAAAGDGKRQSSMSCAPARNSGRAA